MILASQKCVSIQNNVCPLGCVLCFFGLVGWFFFGGSGDCWVFLSALCCVWVLGLWGFVGIFWLIGFGFSVISSCSAEKIMNMVRVSVVED